MTNATLGLGLTICAGALVGGCVAPTKRMRRYQFEHWSFISTLVGQLLLPWAVLFGACPSAISAIGRVDTKILLTANLFSLAWGVANVLFGLCLARIGLSLSAGLLTGIGLPIGVLLPMVFRGTGDFAAAPGFHTPSGYLLLSGVMVMAAGVVLLAKAGTAREKAFSGGRSRVGIVMACIAGVLQVGLSFAFVYTQGPISDALVARGAGEMAAGVGVWAVTLPGGVLINLAYPAWRMSRNRSWHICTSATTDLLLAMLVGVLFFLFVVTLGMGMRWLGALGSSVGFGIYQAAQITSSQLVGIFSGEWRGVCGGPRVKLVIAITLLLVAVVVIATGRMVS